MEIKNTFDDNGKTLQEIMEQFLIIFFYENGEENIKKTEKIL